MTPQQQSIQDYILQYRTIYTREAIDKQLTTAGYNPADIEAAWEAVGEQPTTLGWGDDPNDQPPPKPRSGMRSGLFWAGLVGFVALSYALVALTLAVPSDIGNVLGYIFLGLQVAALVAGIVLLSRNKPLGQGLLFGVLVTVVILPCVVVLVVLGTCLGMFRTSSA